MQVVEKKGNQDEKMLSTKVALLLGKGSLKDFEAVREAEVNDFRATMIERCREAIEARNKFSWEQKVLYHYPPDIESSAEISQLVASRLSPQVGVCVCVCVCTHMCAYVRACSHVCVCGRLGTTCVSLPTGVSHSVHSHLN